MPQRIGHGLLTFLRGKVQNLYIHFVGHSFRMSRSQRIPRHAKAAGREHLFAVLVVGKRARLSHERINDVPIVDCRPLLADKSGHRLNQMSLVSHRDRFGSDAQINFAADQPAGNRIRVGAHVNCAAAGNPDTLDHVVGVEPFIRESVQMSDVIQKFRPPVLVGSRDQLFHERNVLVTRVEITTATQQERLVNSRLEMSVRRFHVTVLIRAAGVRAFRLAVVVTHQRRVTLGEFTPGRVIPHSCGQ